MILRPVLIAMLLIFLVLLTSRLVGLAVANDLLINGAPALPLIPIAGLYWLRPREELAGWSLFTVWLGATYASTGESIEYAVFALIIGLAVAGYFLSPWFVASAWFSHIIWDFFPRSLPTQLLDLPLACLIFDALIGSFIVYRIMTGRWKPRVSAAPDCTGSRSSIKQK
ncbi:MAG: hypothetical protein KDI36_03140 [Pseudomonadales bacterium]|nr:hypothetical protein [Pseudomonadales bacterium]